MFKKTFNFAAVAIAVVAFSSCASVRETAPIIGPADKMLDLNVSTTILDLENAKRVEAEVTKTTTFGIPSYSDDNKTITSSIRYKGIDKCEGRALYKAKNEAGVDVILEPEFTTEKHKWFFGMFAKKIVTVKGWGVNIKGFK